MLRTSSTLPIPNFVSLQPCENTGNAFRAGSNGIVRFNVDPNQFPMIDMLSSYMTFDIQAVNCNSKAQLNGSVEQLFKNMRTYINNTEIESIEGYNILAKVKQDYAMTDQEQKQEGVYDHRLGKALSRGSANIDNNIVKCLTKLNLSGVWGSKVAFTNMAFDGGLQLEIELEDPEKCLRAVDGHNNIECNAFQSSGADEFTQLVIKPERVLVNGVLENANPINSGWCYLDDFPLVVGNRIDIKYNRQDTGVEVNKANVEITNIEQESTTGLVTITFGTQTGGAGASAFYGTPIISLSQGIDGAALALDYQVTNVQLHLRKLEVPAGYAQSLANRVAQGQFMYDVHTYSNYKNSTPATLSNHTLIIPCRASRGKAIMVVPQELNQANDFLTPHEFGGAFNKLKNYLWQFGGQVRPNRAVQLRNTAYAEEYQSAEHLVELDKAIMSSGLGTKNLRNFRTNFLVARSTSAYGSTEDYSPKEILLYLDYYTNDPDGNANVVSAKQHHAFCSHIRRVMAMPNGNIQVFY